MHLLGYSSEGWRQLEADLRRQHLSQDATRGNQTRYGLNYAILAALVGPSGRSVVEVYEPDGLEVEFLTASGRSAALLTLNGWDVRPVSDDDLVSVRPCLSLPTAARK